MSYQDRMMCELDELETRLGKLGDFVATTSFAELPGDDRRLLLLQQSAMQDYATILRVRLLRCAP